VSELILAICPTKVWGTIRPAASRSRTIEARSRSIRRIIPKASGGRRQVMTLLIRESDEFGEAAVVQALAAISDLPDALRL
jgi:hypothetical protein